MRPSLLSKSIRWLNLSFRESIGLIAMLSIVFSTTLQQPIQAQNKTKAQGSRICVPLPVGVTFFVLQGIELSPEQQVSYKQLLAKTEVRAEALINRVRDIEANEISVSPKLFLTPKQLTEREKITRDLEDQTLSILTSEQQKVYQANLVIKRGFQACDNSIEVDG